MQMTNNKLDHLATQVGSIENEIFDDGAEVEVFTLLRSVSEVKSNYQTLYREIQEVQGLQKELSTKLQTQLKLMQAKCHLLKERLSVKAPTAGRIVSPTSTGKRFNWGTTFDAVVFLLLLLSSHSIDLVFISAAVFALGSAVFAFMCQEKLFCTSPLLVTIGRLMLRTFPLRNFS